MNTIERRRFARKRAGWIGTYKLCGRDDEGWFECRVLDYSPAGAGLELFGPHPRHEGEELVVRLELSGRLEGGGVQVPGVVISSTRGASGYHRVGVELRGLGAAEYSSITSLPRTRGGLLTKETSSRAGIGAARAGQDARGTDELSSARPRGTSVEILTEVTRVAPGNPRDTEVEIGQYPVR